MINTYKVWVVVGVVDGDCDLEVIYIASDDRDIIDTIKKMDEVEDVLGWSRVGGGVSEGMERTLPPTLSPLIFEVPL